MAISGFDARVVNKYAFSFPVKVLSSFSSNALTKPSINFHVGQVVRGILLLETRWCSYKFVNDSKSNGDVCSGMEALSKSQIVFPFLNR